MVSDRKIIIKSPQQIGAIRESGKYLTDLLYKLYDQTKPGVTLLSLEKYTQNYLDERKLRGAFK
jgi:methionine aminopeptidase